MYWTINFHFEKEFRFKYLSSFSIFKNEMIY